VLDFQITEQGTHIAYHTSDLLLYLHPLDLYSAARYDLALPVHSQREPYTCFHFDLDPSGKNPEDNLFVGCTRNKYVLPTIPR
jgi:hypothetical protein